MNTNKIKSIICCLIITLMLFSINVFADERACNYYASKGKDTCNSATYQGYKCEWDGNKKGGSRCYKSNNLAESVKENITSCSQIKSAETCRSSKIDGHECIWRQNACYSNTIVDDGSGETIIADDQNDRENKQAETTQDNNQTNTGANNNATDNSVVGENICAEESVQRVLRLVGYIVIIAKVLVPLVLIVMGTIDLFKASVGKDSKDLTKSLKSLMMRIALGVFIFFIPNLVNWAFGLFNENTSGDTTNACVTCVLDPGNC